MELSTLTAIGPIDGRYADKTATLREYFSEYGLMKYRIIVEIEYFIALLEVELPQLQHLDFIKSIAALVKIRDSFDQVEANRIKEIEKTTNHDVKAVEYWLREKFDEAGLKDVVEFIHFGLTSQDVNNTAIPLSLKEFTENDFVPALNQLIAKMQDLASEWKDISMLARTHGQPASPTKLGKEIKVFTERISTQLYQMESIAYSAKFGGATGNFNAHQVAYPNIDWVGFADNFIAKLGLQRTTYTTQIENYDNLSARFDALKRINNILIDFCRDIWHYVSIEYFKQKTKAGEVGSSAMPHKVNPIDFENAEGNLGIANALLEHLSAKLPISRLQRDLTDSTVLRNIGVPFAHSLIAYNSILKGLGKLLLNQSKLEEDLNNNWAVVAEAIQTILRREMYPHPYDALKQLTRGADGINKESLHRFIDNLEIKQEVKDELKKISPFNYTGITEI